MIFSKTKISKKYKKNVVIFLLCLVSFTLLSFLKVEAARQMEGMAFLTDKTGQMISGDYTVRFAIYSTDRTTIDNYPSDVDKDQRVWEETQTVTIKNGVLNFNLGQTQELPILDNPQGTHYFLGIRINEDSELVPRKKITSSLFAYNATNATLLNGKKIGTNSGDILALNNLGKIDLQNLPIGTGEGQLITGNDSRLNDSLTLSGAKYLTLKNQKLTANKIKLSSDTQGTLPVSQGGTGLTDTQAGKLLMGTGSGYAFGSILGSGNVNVATTSSNISISLKDTINVSGLDVTDRLYLADSSVPTTPTNNLYSSSGNLYWGTTNLSSGGTTYTKSGTLLQLTGTTFSIQEGTLTNNKICTYSTTDGLVCNTDPASAGVETDPIFSASPSATITNTNITDWNAKESLLTFSTGLSRVVNTITNTDLGSTQNIFKTITVSGQSNLTTDQNSDTLTLVAGTNVTLTTDAAVDSITINSTDTDTNTTYSAAASNLLQLTGTEFSVKQGTMTDTRLCAYSATLGLVCDTSTSSFAHDPASINPTIPNGLTINGSQQISLALSTTSTTGALSSTDWNIFNNKQPAGSYLTSNQTITLSGDVTGSGGTAITTTIGADKITESMLVASATPASGNVLTYNGTNGFTWVATAPGTAHNLFSSTHGDTASVTPAQGDIIYYNGSSWTTLTAGTNGNFLRTNGTGAAPSWQTATGTTYTAAASPNLLQLTGTEFSVKQGTMTDTRLCVYSATLGLVCDTSTSSFGHDPLTINSTANGLTVDGSQQLSLALSTTSTTGALSST
ncbi:MAG: hypothetical protein WA069_02085, partial [Candidatus Moraniibacteriota bacterium]